MTPLNLNQFRLNLTPPILLVQSVLLFVVLLFKAHAVVMRHDVNPSEYLLDTLDYQSTIHIDGCTATLIEPKWVLTAAHCIKEFYPKGTQIKINDESIAVETTFVHPEFNPEQSELHDVALIKLREPSYGTLPTPLYLDSDELGKIGKIAGFGLTGNGESGILNHCFPCELHVADNEIAETFPYLLRVRFDAPERTGSLILEGVSGGGDSGAPLYLTKNNTRYIAGVSSFGGIYYGDSDHFVRISQEMPWLSQTLGEDYSGNFDGLSYDEISEQNTMPDDKTESGGGTVANLMFLLLSSVFFIRRGSNYQYKQLSLFRFL